MKIVLEIPGEFTGHYKGDRFKDSFERIAHDARCHRIIAGLYEYELIDMLIEAFRRSEVIDDQKLS